MDKAKEKMPLVKAIRYNGRAWGIWWKQCPGLFVSITLSSFMTAVSPYVSIWMIARIVDELAGSRQPQAVLRLVLAFLFVTGMITFAGNVFACVKRYETDSANCRYDRVFMDKMFSLDYEHMDSQGTYDLYSQIVQNDKWSGLGLHETIVLFENLITAGVRILGGMVLACSMFFAKVPEGRNGFLWLNHPLCVWILLLGLLLISVCSAACGDKGQGYWIRYADETRFGNRLAEYYVFFNKDKKRAMDLRMYEQQENICSVYLERENPFTLSSKIVRYAKGPMGAWMAGSKSISAILTAAVYWFVCLKAWAGAYGPGFVTQYIGASMNLFLGVADLINSFSLMISNGNFLEDVYEFLDISNTMYQGSLTTEKRMDRQYEIEFQDVSFRYPGTEKDVLSHVNMKFPVGSRLAVVGLNGSGKTTFIKLLCRLYDVTEGQILLNGIDIRKYRYEDYRNHFSVVFQDFQLFAGPLGETIAGSKGYEVFRAEDCLEKAGFVNWREVMGNGLYTFLYQDVEEKGVEVSGGEAQKIAIARALYKDAPFMILDEPTAALDPVAEAEIYGRLNDIAGDRTSVYISHRLSSCKFCDIIAVFHEGKVVQTGSHEELIADGEGMYQKLWNAQAQYYRQAEVG